MAITLDASVYAGNKDGQNPYTWNHTVGATAVLLVVAITVNGGTNDVSGVTYKGVALSKAVDVTQSASNCEIWYLVRPPKGTNAIVVTHTGTPTYVRTGSLSFIAPNRVDTIGTQSATSGVCLITLVTKYDGSIMIDAFFKTVTGNAIAGAGQSVVYQSNPKSDDYRCGVSYKIATTKGNNNMTWTDNTGAHAYVAAAFTLTRGGAILLKEI